MAEASKTYISRKDEQIYEQILFKTNKALYCKYKAFKIHWYIVIKYDLKIVRMNLTWLTDN